MWGKVETDIFGVPGEHNCDTRSTHVSDTIAGNQTSHQTTACPISLSGRHLDLLMWLFITMFPFGTSWRPYSTTRVCYINHMLAKYSKYYIWEARSKTQKSCENGILHWISYLNMETPRKWLRVNKYKVIIIICISSTHMKWLSPIRQQSHSMTQNLEKHRHLGQEHSLQRWYQLLEKKKKKFSYNMYFQNDPRLSANKLLIKVTDCVWYIVISGPWSKQ